MQKKLIGLLLAVVMCAGLLVTAAPSAKALDMPDAYANFLQELRHAIDDLGLDTPDHIQKRLDSANVSQPVRDYLFCIWSDSQNDDLYQTRFALRDLNGDGVPELLLTCGNAGEVPLSDLSVTLLDDLDMICTVRSGAVVTVADFQYRDLAAVYGTTVVNHGSGGAAYYGCDFDVLPAGATQLRTLASYDIVYETNPPRYYLDYYGNRNSRISADQARAMHRQYMTGDQPDWIYLFEEPFVDVVPTDWYYEPVDWARDVGVTTGTGPSVFSPNAPCTRGQVVTFLWRAAGEPEPKSAAIPFTDVHAGDYFCKAVLWAAEQGITTGTGGNLFSPEAPCTRAQVVTFLWRADGEQKISAANPFRDVAAGAYYYNAVLWAVDAGITNGTSADLFSPDATCTRAQVVTFLYRY